LSNAAARAASVPPTSFRMIPVSPTKSGSDCPRMGPLPIVYQQLFLLFAL
jgi:hypothetical protein